MKITKTPGQLRPAKICRVVASFIFALLMPMLLSGCIEDGVTTSASDQPEFSTPEVDLGTLFTSSPSATYHFTVYNRHDKVLSISKISLREGDSSAFRLNVDGESARTFHGIEIRPNDSIYVFVESTIPPKGAATDYLPFDIEDSIDFLTNGVTRSVRIKAKGQDVEEVTDAVISTATRWDSHPRRVKGELRIAEGGSLTIGKGVSVYFHKGAGIRVEGSLVTEGVPDAEGAPGMVTLRGDRLDNVVGAQGYDLLASQWGGIDVAPTGRVSFSHTDMRGTEYGLRATGEGGKMPQVTLLNSRLHRSGGNALSVTDGHLKAVGTELSDSKDAMLSLSGGEAQLTNCTLINYYISSVAVGPLLKVADSEATKVKATVDNCLMTNFRTGECVQPGDLTGFDVRIRSTLISAAGSDDDNFIGCLWNAWPDTYENHQENEYDYRLRAGSPGAGAGNPALLVAEGSKDMYGVTRRTDTPAMGAYEVE
ncbi:MAG: hypothetical protein NC187_07070 [Candidatus Amulumruptor caecigallinarius]|nr:hypothetical protein [Candidatus Amulumruptor caecigallinarius]MCM1397229.1 hypothetical protein [Candidatus Amulumruptor caecigallinarius]MCM1454774.1 hypothetical protein [bacterium]